MSAPDLTLEEEEEGHQGIEKTKSLLREKIWYPYMNQKVKEMIEGCSSCQAVGIGNPVEPMMITPTEDRLMVSCRNRLSRTNTKLSSIFASGD